MIGAASDGDPVVDAHLANMALRGRSPNTIRERHRTLRRLVKFLGCDLGDLLALTDDDLERWQQSLANHSPSYRAGQNTHVSGFYSWAIKRDLLLTSPTRRLVNPRQPGRVPRPIAPDDLELALAGAPGRIRPWLILAAYAGLRAAEIAELTRDQVRDTDDPPFLIILGKGNKERVVPMSSLVRRELLAYGLPARGFVFPRGDGKPGANRPWHVSHLANDYLHSLGIPHSLHSLRHYFGTRAYAVSNDLRMTQHLMGHSSPTTTAGYVAFSNRKAFEAVEEISLDRAPREDSPRDSPRRLRSVG